jgi:hypothetical protein
VTTKPKPTKAPSLSGFCDPPLPTHERHRHCITEGCPCPCHRSWPDGSPRVKVPLACLQGAHTVECGHLTPAHQGPHGNASTLTLEEALALESPQQKMIRTVADNADAELARRIIPDLELTDDEIRAVIRAILETVARIIRERQTP